MPELPEVETVRRQLDERLRGAVLKNITLLRTGRERPAGQAFVKALKGQRIQKIERRAKLLIWRLENGDAILAHLKMTGKFLFVEANHKPTKHDAIMFEGTLKTGKAFSLVWNDVRKFGFMEYVSPERLAEKLGEYGPEPLEVSVKDLTKCLDQASDKRTLKATLLDQSCIAGVGNIYADEACHRVGLQPSRKLGTVSQKDRARLAEAVQAVLRESLAQRGTSAHSYMDTTGSKGGFLEFLRVYGRDGEPCRTCGTIIIKSRVAQRGTHACPSCQR